MRLAGSSRGETAYPRHDVILAWELLYRLEPELYDRLASAERLHPGVVGWLPCHVDLIAEVSAGTGRLTMELAGRGRQVVAVEPALPLRRILARKLAAAGHGDRVRVIPGFFDQLPLPDDFADLVVACSAFTPSSAHGGEAGLAEMERVCPAGRVRGYHLAEPPFLAGRPWLPLRQLPGGDVGGFRQLCRRGGAGRDLLPKGADSVRRRGERTVPFEVLGINPPRDLAFKVLAG